MRKGLRHRRLLALCAGAIVVSVGVAYAAIPHSQSGVISGCYKGDDNGGGKGQLRVIDTEKGETCKQNETALSWNQKGDPGAQGIQGIQGPQGDQGLKGDKGEQGIQGLKGDQGDQGIQGIKGDQGEQGIQGIQGIQGEKGDKGETGGQGPQGLQGDKGDKGDPGDDGADGAGLESLDQFDGLPCTRDGDEGESELTYDDDGFARLQCVVEDEPAPCVDSTDNSTPDAAIFLGSIGGAEDSPVVQRTARLCGGSDWWRVSVREPDFTPVDFLMSAEIQVAPTPGDPDLRVFCRHPSSGDSFLAGVSTLPGQAVEGVRVRRVENAGPGGGFFELLIQVSGFAIPTDYTLTVWGNLANAEVLPNNCDLE